ncbi:MAG: UPF0236 family protein, partial [Thermoguttaceae bacterium]|nr:UPF0236 family protein [Thermoguttaceae bacterium]
RNRGRKKKRIVTAVGVITYSRSHYECMPCHYSEFYADRSIAKDVTTTTTGGRNLIALAGGSWGYESATRYLKTFTGIVVSKNTVRAITQQAGKLANKWQLASPHAAQKFIEAKGVQEMLTDGTMVNTQKGWKEVRLTLFSKRLTGTVADYTMMNDRLLPAPGVTFCFGRMESAKKCVSRWSSLAKHLRIHNFQNLHVLADGAKWIWNGAEKTFPNHDGCLDFYHACEHLHEAASNFCKDEKQVRELYETWRTSLAKNGWEGLKKEFLQMKENLSKHRWKK